MQARLLTVRVAMAAGLSMVGQLAAQMTPPAAPPKPAAPAAAPAFERPSAYPVHAPADPEKIAKGKAVFGVNCSFCHGSDARGGEGGPNLIRSELVLNDKDGEAIATVVQNGRVDKGMPKFDLPMPTISALAAYIHSFKVGGYDISRNKPVSILVGDAAAGHAAFDAKCASCHSASGDLKDFGSKFTDPKILQQTFLMPGGGGRGPAAVNLVSVTLDSGEKVEGSLVRIDDFLVSLTEKDGTVRTFRRDGDKPHVEIKDPLKPHKDMLPTYTDKEIHDLTAYLVTLK